MSLFKDIHLLIRYRKPFKVIESFLPVSLKTDEGKWCVANRIGIEDALYFETLMQEVKMPTTHVIDVLKQKRGRRILRLRQNDRGLIIKAFTFYDSLGRQLYRHRFFAYDEAAGLILAAKRGIAVPNVLAYGEGRSGCRRLWNVVAMESIEDAVHPTEVFRGSVNSGFSTEEVMQRLVPLMLQIYSAGCNHIDLHGTSFLLSKNDVDLDRVIDFQYAVFHNKPSMNIFCHQIAHFIRASVGDVDVGLLHDWAKDIFKQIAFDQYKAHLDKCIVLSRAPVPSAYHRMTLQP